jgi:pentatricopeptide repeat protein
MDDRGAEFDNPEARRMARISHLFDELLESQDPSAVLAREPDAAVRDAAHRLWQHHLSAGRERFLEKPINIEILPVLTPGQLLLDRFEIRRSIGHGGMGEVYLAFDRKLDELVALKTISRSLASSESIRRRFVAEVQSARRVTHPNVCRIHELFEDGATTFFAMEYVDGTLLSDWIGDSAQTRKAAPLLVRQLAEGLHAAHLKGVVHGDFKPSNVIVVPGDTPRAVIMDFGLAHVLASPASIPMQSSPGAGTPQYMAPELLTGSPLCVQTDIYAFGKVALRLLPGIAVLEGCAKPHPGHRLTSLDPVIAYLGRDLSRRYWIGGTLLVGAGAVAYGLSSRSASPHIEAGARLLVNGFQSAAEMLPRAKFVRAMVITALQQSERIRPIADQDLWPALRAIAPSTDLPLSGESLHRIVTLQNARYWVDGVLKLDNGRASLSVNLFRGADGGMVTQSAFQDAPSLGDLAAQASTWIRRLAGESDRSLSLNPSLVPAYTSSVPEALQNYYEGMERYSRGKMADAIPFLSEAVRLDPSFAQAQNILGRCLESVHRYAEAFEAIDRAIRLTTHLPRREKIWIEASYYSLVEDPVLSVQAAQTSANLYPDEPRFHRLLGQQFGRVGSTAKALDPIRKAIELAPRNELYPDVLMEGLCENGNFEEALATYQSAHAQGNRNPFLETGHGLALLGLEKYTEAEASFRQSPAEDNATILVQGARILAGQMEGAVAALRQHATHEAVDGNEADRHQAAEFLCGSWYLLDQPKLAAGALEQMLALPVYPPYARQWQCTASWAARLNHDDALKVAAARTAEIAGRWKNGLTLAVSQHAQALGELRRNSFDAAEKLLHDSLGSAFTVWSLFDLAALYLTQSRLDLAREYWQQLEDRRGIILRRWFTGTVILIRLNQAIAAHRSGDAHAARQWAKKVLEPWGAGNPHTTVAQAAHAIAG